MRRFFVSLLIISLIATAGAFYWRTYLPENPVAADGGATRNLPDAAPSPAAPGQAPTGSVQRQPSERQDMAVTISIVSSIISALAAVMQTWLTARAVRQ